MTLPNFLKDKYKNWKKNIFEPKKNIYEVIASKNQRPKAMIISCCDSRVQENLIFGADCGDYFIHKNISNLVPPFNLLNNHSGTSSAIQYAVESLKVSNIIIMGHSNCGGIKHSCEIFSKKTKLNTSNALNKWLKFLKPVFNTLPKNLNINEKAKLLEKESIKNSVSNLYEYSYVKKQLKKKKIKIHGIWYDIRHGDIYYLSLKTGNFKKVNY